jgi:hypothetical protein
VSAGVAFWKFPEFAGICRNRRNSVRNNQPSFFEDFSHSTINQFSRSTGLTRSQPKQSTVELQASSLSTQIFNSSSRRTSSRQPSHSADLLLQVRMRTNLYRTPSHKIQWLHNINKFERFFFEFNDSSSIGNNTGIYFNVTTLTYSVSVSVLVPTLLVLITTLIPLSNTNSCSSID